MRKTKKILSILLACLMLTSLLSVGVYSAGTQDDPIDAATKWFGYGVDTYLLNPTIAAGSDGTWYTLTAENAGVLFLEHSYKNVDYTITVTHNGVVYEGGCVNGEPYNRPIVTAPIALGDVVTVHVATKDAAAGTVYASMNVIAADVDNPIKVKSHGLTVTIGAGKTVYFQDDSLNAIYATKGLLVEGNVADVSFYNVSKNTESGNATLKAVTDSDADGVIEAQLGGSLGGAGAPAVKPAWAIENKSGENRIFTLTIVDAAHECNWDDDNDTDCNTCGAIREVGYPMKWNGWSVSEDVNGLASRFDLQVEGMTTNGTKAVYDNATFAGYKLVSMGAIVCNNYALTNVVPTHKDVDNKNVVDIAAKYLCNVDEEAGTVSFAVRITDIPDTHKDTYIMFVPYVVLADAEGNQYTQYITSWTAAGSYNEAIA